MASTTAAMPPALLEAMRNATLLWQEDLQELFHHAKERFPDVVWETAAEGEQGRGLEEVWGHKAIVYTRAPPSFQQRYFSFRPPPPTSPLPYSTSPTGILPAQSSLSLTLGLELPHISRSPSPSPYRAASPAPSTAQTQGGVLRLTTPLNSTLFANELEYLYTGKGFGEAFEFLFDSPEGSAEDGEDGENARVDKLRKDLVFMWRSRLYSDVRIALTGDFSSTNHEPATAVFSTHRFILVSRSPYFKIQLLQWGLKPTPGEPLTLTLPSPPFTPASLHFTLGFIYTGTLAFSHRTFDLDTAFHIMRSAAYLSLDTLYDEIQARIVQEMMHGLFHAFLEFAEYERITGGKWGTGGCRCRQCARRAPRVLEFALQDDVKNPHLERGARRALVGLFGEGWCNAEFAHLPQKTRDGLRAGLAKRTTPMNIFLLLFASHAALKKLEPVIEPWGEVVREMIVAARRTIDEVLAGQAETCFEQPEWLSIMDADGVRFEDGEQVELIMESLQRGINDKNAATLYQILVSSILLRPHPTEPSQTMLSPTSHVRVQVEQTRMEVVRHLQRRWLNIRQEGGFDGLDSWALKEISHEIDIPVEDLLAPAPSTTLVKSHGNRSSTLRPEKQDDDTISIHSLRTTAIRNAGRQGETVKSSSVSIRSVARSTHSTASRVSTASQRTANSPKTRPDSKLTPAQPGSTVSTRSSMMDSDSFSLRSGATSPRLPREPNFNRIRVPSTSSMTTDRSQRVKSSATSVKSTVSRASTVRKSNAAGPSTLRPTSNQGRPRSAVSSTSESSTNFETAKSDMTPTSTRRSRVTSTTSTISITSTRTTTSTSTSSPRVSIKSRPPSAASKSSANSGGRRPPPSPSDSNKLSPAMAKRTSSTASTRSSVSSASASTSASAARRSTVTKKSSKQSVAPAPPPKNLEAKPTKADAVNTIKAKSNGTATVVKSHEKQASVVSSGSVSTVKGSLKRKNSTDTITEYTAAETHLSLEPFTPRGATLEIGIPCIITSKRARFRAYARYIGEVEGEAGPWVGVEVPVDEDWPQEKLEGRQWNDGSWGGIRYFDIGSNGASEWEYGDERVGATTRRRKEWGTGSGFGFGGGSLKREGDVLSIERAKRLRSASPVASDISSSESRGLFVRPQQVLYVVDAVP